MNNFNSFNFQKNVFSGNNDTKIAGGLKSTNTDGGRRSIEEVRNDTFKAKRDNINTTQNDIKPNIPTKTDAVDVQMNARKQIINMRSINKGN